MTMTEQLSRRAMIKTLVGAAVTGVAAAPAFGVSSNNPQVESPARNGGRSGG